MPLPPRGLPGIPGLFLGSVLLVSVVAAFRPISDPDFFWHLRVGEWIADHRSIPHLDLFTFTASGHPFVAHEWLSEVLMALLNRGAGFGAVVAFFGLVTLGGFAVLLVTAREAGWLWRGLALVAGLLAASPVFGPRTQMITFTLSAVLLLLLRRHRETGDTRWLYAVPPMFILWANAHAGFTFGLALLLAHLVGEAMAPHRVAPLRPVALTAALAGVAVALNPNAFAIYSYAWHTQLSSAQQQLIVEWHSPDFHLAAVRPFEVMLLGILVLLVVSPQRLRPTDLLLLGAATVLALQSVRHIALFVVVAVPVAADLATATWAAKGQARLPLGRRLTGRGPGILNALILLLLAAGVTGFAAAAVRGSGPATAAIGREYPVTALDSVAPDPPPGRMMNLYDWGGYAIYRLWPREKVFIYGDAAVMGDALLSRYRGIAFLAPDFNRQLAAMDIEWVLYRTNDPLTVVLEQEPDWVVLHADRLGTILVHRDSRTATYLAAHGLG